jgi:hypothetical protein
MLDFYKVKDNPGFVKNPRTGVILNTNLDVVDVHERRFNKIKKEQRLEQDVVDLKSELQTLKNIIKQLVEGDKKV